MAKKWSNETKKSNSDLFFCREDIRVLSLCSIIASYVRAVVYLHFKHITNRFKWRTSCQILNVNEQVKETASIFLFWITFFASKQRENDLNLKKKSLINKRTGNFLRKYWLNCRCGVGVTGSGSLTLEKV